ncbi:alpha/beta-Hydrolases superfamily protein [Actinidia rufa]|uniref:Alpha/beta-Hydrolases superfamily protein n=1 Tax=Actinidia rufa TaxID=165716 RepID=A0A7J0FJY8_9ERIC|nr:alpha/beta-Hydrolases superfamily protein [Actinidia rufa]
MSRERPAESSDNAERAGDTEDVPVDDVIYQGSGWIVVSQAFDALTGMEDFKQVAVNSVFGVIEDMMTQLEVEKEKEADVDDSNINSHYMGLHLCNTIATSKQTLLLHAEGKKHRAKARAFHAANKQPERAESTPNAKAPPQSNQKDELTGNMGIDQPKDENPPSVSPLHNGSEVGNRNSLSSKKQKLEASKNGTKDMAGGDMPGELGNGEMIQSKEQRKRKPSAKLRKRSSVTEEDANKKIKWKKLIKSVLKSPCIITSFHPLRCG